MREADWAEGESHLPGSDNGGLGPSQGNSGAGTALQRCPKLRQGDRGFAPSTRTGHWMWAALKREAYIRQSSFPERVSGEVHLQPHSRA